MSASRGVAEPSNFGECPEYAKSTPHPFPARALPPKHAKDLRFDPQPRSGGDRAPRIRGSTRQRPKADFPPLPFDFWPGWSRPGSQGGRAAPCRFASPREASEGSHRLQLILGNAPKTKSLGSETAKAAPPDFVPVARRNLT